MHNMIAWLQSNKMLLGWLFGLSAVLFIGSLVALPWFVVRIPADYFLHRRQIDRWHLSRPIWRYSLMILKNLCGAILVLAGIAMLVLPGQGILTILVGLIFLDFPGKLTFEQYLARQRAVARAINWMRAKAARPPLIIPEPERKRSRRKKRTSP